MVLVILVTSTVVPLVVAAIALHVLRRGAGRLGDVPTVVALASPPAEALRRDTEALTDSLADLRHR